MVTYTQGGKKKKKTKKQLQEELEKQQEELRIQEALEKERLEEEERRRKEEERIRQEIEAKLRQEEAARLIEEQKGAAGFIESIRMELDQIQKRNESTNEWDKYLLCDKMPDPTNENQLTAYITLLSEKPVQYLEDALEMGQETEEVVNRVNRSLGDALESYDSDKKIWSRNYINTLRSLGRRKIDEVTAYIMQYTEEYLFKAPEPTSTTGAKHLKTTADPTPSKEAFLKGMREDIKIGIWINYQNTGHKFRPIQFDELNMYAEMPRQYADDPCVMRVHWNSFDHVSGNQSPYMTLGGIYEVEIYGFPDLPKRVKKWTIRDISAVEDILIVKPYPPNDFLSGVSMANVNPLRVGYTLPDKVYLPDESLIKVCAWDSNEWQEADISEVAFDGRQVNFRTRRLVPLAVLMPKITYYPYTYWYLRAVSNEKVLLQLQSPRMTFDFEITPGKLEYKDKTGAEELKHFVGKVLPPGELLLEMQKSGLHLLPEDRDCIDAGIKQKSIDAEEQAIFDISMTIHTFAFRSSKWNKSAPETMVLAIIRENLEFDEFFAEDEDHDWRTIAWQPVKSSFVNAREIATDMDLSIPEGHETHFLLRSVMSGNVTETAEERMNTLQNIELSETVKRTLRLLRLLSFTQSYICGQHVKLRVVVIHRPPLHRPLCQGEILQQPR